MPGNPALRNFAAKQVKQYGRQFATAYLPRRVTPTGSPALDFALRVGGWVEGFSYELVGKKDAGKSTTCLIAAAIHQGLYPDLGVAYVDVEKTFDVDWAHDLGVDCSKAARKAGRWLHYYPETSEAASDMARDAAASGLVSLIIVDSIGGMESKKALEKDAEKVQPGSNAQVITRLSKHLANWLRVNHCTAILVNQYRADIGSMIPVDKSAGPKAMEHSTVAKIEMAKAGGEKTTRTEEIWGADETVGGLHRARVTRLKNGARSRVAEWWLMNQPTEQFGPVGVDLAESWFSLGKKTGVIDQMDGGYYMLPGDVKLRGQETVLAYLREHREMHDAIRAKVPFDEPENYDDPEEG